MNEKEALEWIRDNKGMCPITKSTKSTIRPYTSNIYIVSFCDNCIIKKYKNTSCMDNKETLQYAEEILAEHFPEKKEDNFKVRCISTPFPKDFIVGNIYEIIEGTIQGEFDFASYSYFSNIEELNRRMSTQFELVEDTPTLKWEDVRGKHYIIDTKEFTIYAPQHKNNIHFAYSVELNKYLARVQIFNDKKEKVEYNYFYGTEKDLPEILTKLKKYYDIDLNVQVKSEKDKKIEKLEATIEKAQQQIKELKEVKD